ncbi:hypothetical protein BpHYR1_044410 [Brachionus plicatilis]|uniref:Uncharacterized protein n=1 Tax=Brachionus plicatilis TaxID=10195 RepID=A0A3M7RHD1_BRAPC|nr:hypothetical protein BpHYR1_044410 [Brachionus plicatilis]
MNNDASLDRKFGRKILSANCTEVKSFFFLLMPIKTEVQNLIENSFQFKIMIKMYDDLEDLKQ